MNSTNPGIFNLQFILLCVSSFLFFTSFNMIIPELPSFLDDLGGGEYKGLIISIFTLTAGLSRPISGKLTDRVGRIPVMIFGAVVCCFVGLLYPMVLSVFGFFALRLFHGLSTGFKPTGTAAFVADVVPVERRGEAMGFLGISGGLGLALGPFIGPLIAQNYSLEWMFYSSSIAAILSVAVIVGMKETLKEREPFKWSLLRIHSSEVLEPRAFPPSIVMLLSAYSFGVMLTLIPDLSDTLSLTNRGTFFTTFTLASLLVRFLAGKASDRWGRVVVLKTATIVLAVSMGLIAYSSSVAILLFAGVVFGMASGMTSPTIFAWTIDLSRDEHRGRALSTMFIALEIGIGVGALLSGWIYSNDYANLKPAFLSGCVFAVMAFLYLQFIHIPKVGD